MLSPGIFVHLGGDSIALIFSVHFSVHFSIQFSVHFLKLLTEFPPGKEVHTYACSKWTAVALVCQSLILSFTFPSLLLLQNKAANVAGLVRKP